MNTKFLAAVSMLAIFAAAPAIAADTTVKTKTQTETNANTPSVKKDVSRGWEDTKQAVSNAADKTSQTAQNAYEDIKATFIGNDQNASSSTTVTINSSHTASGMIGQSVVDSQGKKIAKIDDILLNPDGTATTVVVADGGFMGIGTKLAAFDYGMISSRQADGDVVMPISEDTLKKVSAFSYDKKDAGKGVIVAPADSIRVSKLLDGHVLNTKNENVAEIDNVSFKNGKADQVILAFDQTLGLGGKRATMDFSSLQQKRDGDNVNLQLSANQEANFESFKSAKNY